MLMMAFWHVSKAQPLRTEQLQMAPTNTFEVPQPYPIGVDTFAHGDCFTRLHFHMSTLVTNTLKRFLELLVEQN